MFARPRRLSLYSIYVFADLSKAYCTIAHEMLVKALEYGARGLLARFGNHVISSKGIVLRHVGWNETVICDAHGLTTWPFYS